MGNLFFFCAQASPADVFYRSRNLVEEIDSQTTDTGSATDDTIPRACALQGEGGRERERGWEREREHPLTPPAHDAEHQIPRTPRICFNFSPPKLPEKKYCKVMFS
jgi:hypothetical protein